MTPAMPVGVANRLWYVSDLVALLEAAEAKMRREIGNQKRLIRR